MSFHGKIIELSGNRTLLRVWRSLEPFSRTYLTLVMPGSNPHWSAGLHAPIVEALRSRDTDGVVRALASHFTEVSDVLASRLEATGPGDNADARGASARDPGGKSADGNGNRTSSGRAAAASPRRARGSR